MTDVTDRKLTEKKDRVLGALEQGMTQLHLDARRPGVLCASCNARKGLSQRRR